MNNLSKFLLMVALDVVGIFIIAFSFHNDGFVAAVDTNDVNVIVKTLEPCFAGKGQNDVDFNAQVGNYDYLMFIKVNLDKAQQLDPSNKRIALYRKEFDKSLKKYHINKKLLEK